MGLTAIADSSILAIVPLKSEIIKILYSIIIWE